MLPTVRGVIDRRILVNFRVDPGVLADRLPEPFSLQTVDGYAVGGICLIRLCDLRPRGVPSPISVRSENAAHRIAVTWIDDGEQRTGVYVPRRDTNSRLNSLLGGRLFPGVHHHAAFDVQESDDEYEISMDSDDGTTHIKVAGQPTESLPDDSVFESVQAVSTFFEKDSLGHSPNERTGEFDAIELDTHDWEVTPLSVTDVASSYFDALPDDTARFDHALLMCDIEHEWSEGEAVCAVPPDTENGSQPNCP